MAYEEGKQRKPVKEANNTLDAKQSSLQSNHKKESWRGTSDPSKVDKYVDCDERDGWC